MPGSIISELILRPVLEIVLHVIGYWTGRVVVPVLSLGLVRIDPADRKQVVRPRAERKRAGPPPRDRRGFHRAPDGAIIIDEEMAMYVGALFWVAVGIAAYFLFR